MILYKNANFYVNNSYVNKIIVKDNLIYKIGSECNNIRVNKEIDLNNSYVYPGFKDSHIHLLGYGRKLYSNNISHLNEKNDILSKIKELYKEDTLKIEGYYNIGINSHDLDNISKDNYIILRHNDYHSFTVNSKVLKDLNIKSSDGIILDDNISKLIIPLWEDSNKETLIKYGKKAIETLIKYGITSVSTDDLSYFNSYSETINILKDLSNQYKFNINTLIHIDILDEYIKYYPKDKYLKDIGVKMFYDGTLSSKTAYISGSYNNHQNGYFDDSLFLKQLKRVRDYKKDILVHVIGDEALNRLNKHLTNNDRIIHASLIDESIINKLNTKFIDIQPLFYDKDKLEVLKFNNFKGLIHPFQKLINNNYILNLSSDAPVEDPNPLKTIEALLNRDINIKDIIKMYTYNESIHLNNNSGLIKEGFIASFTCFNNDLLKINLKNINKYKTTYTIVNNTIYNEK